MFDDHDGSIRHVDSDLDDRRRDEELDLAFIERLHHAIFFCRFHASVNESAGNAAHDVCTKFFVDLFCRHEIHPVAVFDKRTYDVCLPAAFDLFPDVLIDERTSAHRAQKGTNGLAPRRQMPNRRDIQIPVDGERHRARDRRCRHDERIWYHLPLFCKLRALCNAKAMLLIRHDEPQARKRYTILYERMRPDDDIDIMSGNRLVNRLAFFPSPSPRQECDPYAKRLQNSAKRFVMLLGKNFCRCHERALKPIFYGLDKREHRDDSLPGSDIALHEPAHRNRALHIAFDFLPRRRLILRQGKGKKRQKRPNELVVGQMANAFFFLMGMFPYEEETALDEVEFLKGKRVTCVLEMRQIFGKVDRADGIRASHKFVLRANLWRKRLLCRKILCKNLSKNFMEKRLAERPRNGVNRENAAKGFRSFLSIQNLKSRHPFHCKLAMTAKRIANLSRDEHLDACFDLAKKIALIKP